MIEIGTDKNGKSVVIHPQELTRHLAFLGGTGSGKTTAALDICEQLLLHQIPIILVDRKGDLCGYAGKNVWDVPNEDQRLSKRQKELKERINISLYTPGNPNGNPLAFPLIPADVKDLSDFDRDTKARHSAIALANMLKSKDEVLIPVLTKAISLLTLKTSTNGKNFDLEDLIFYMDNAEDYTELLDAIGILPKNILKKIAQELQILKLNIEHLLAGSEDLDMNKLIRKDRNHTNLSIISTKFLRDKSTNLFWVTQFLLDLERWISKNPSEDLQAILMLDEADLYLPATSKPSTKEPLESLIKRGRSAGLGIILATQNPGDLDYRCRENVRSWFIGVIKEANALNKIKPMFGIDTDPLCIIPRQKIGEFHFVSEGKVVQIKTNLSLLKTIQVPEDDILELARNPYKHDTEFILRTCPNCGVLLRVKPNVIGHPGECSECHKFVTLK